MAWLLRAKAAAIAAPATDLPDRITLDELRELEQRGEHVVIADARKDAAYYSDGRKATGSIRLDPDDPVPDAEGRKLPRDATIAVYCA